MCACACGWVGVCVCVCTRMSDKVHICPKVWAKDKSFLSSLSLSLSLSPSAAGPAGMPNLGGMDFSTFLNNPAFMNMV